MKRKTIPKDMVVLGIHVSANESSWMNANEFVKYIEAIVLPYLRREALVTT